MLIIFLSAMNKKYLFIALGLTLFLGIFFTWQKGYLSNNQGLNLYRNDKYDFELNYPKSWNISDDRETRIFSDKDAIATQNCKKREQELIDQNIAFGPTGCKFGVFINILTRQEIEVYYQAWTPYIMPDNANSQAFLLNRDYLPADLAIAVALPDDDKFILIEIYNTVDVREVSNQILSTFKFLGN